jgi:c-di-GMP-binding flagellar brake protein YcgR
MFGRGRSSTKVAGELDTVAQTTGRRAEEQQTLLDVAFPMQQVRLRWHSMNGGEVSVPGQIQSIDGEIVDVWFDRSAPSFNPLHSDDQIWVDVFFGSETFVFASWLIGMRPPDTMVILVQGLPRKDQRRQYVRERVDLPPQPLVPLDEEGEPCGPVQEVVLLDMSGGGARLETSQKVPVKGSLQLTLDLGLGPFDVVVTIVDVYETVSGRQIVRGYFAEIEERFRRDVIRFIFKEQLRKARLSPD